MLPGNTTKCLNVTTKQHRFSSGHRKWRDLNSMTTPKQEREVKGIHSLRLCNALPSSLMMIAVIIKKECPLNNKFFTVKLK